MWKNRAKATWNSRFRRNVREKYAKLAREKKKWWKINVRGCGKLGFINCEIHRVWESGDINTGFQQGVENGVDNLHLPKITALEKAVGNFRERLQSFFSLLFQSTSPCNISIHVPTVVREEERTSPFQINYIDCGRRLLLRGGRTEGFRRHPSASTGFTVELGLAINFCLRTFLPISRAATHKMSNELRSFSGA